MNNSLKCKDSIMNMLTLIAEIKEKNASFGTSLLLANIGGNSPISPKIVDGSFAALFETDDVVVDFSKKLKNMQKDIHSNCKFPACTK